MKDATLEHLTDINQQDLLSAFGVERSPLGRMLIGRLFRGAARRFATQVLDYDNGVEQSGLRAGAARTLQSYTVSLQVTGQECLPDSGPLLILANHPGMTDTLALFAAIPRRDLLVVAAERPFLRALPATCRQLTFVPADPNTRMEVVRSIAAHLRAGGAVLTFPAGEIEPDPGCMPGALAALDRWSDSIGFFTRLVPDAVILPAIVSGVIVPASLRHPLTRLRRSPRDRERLAAALQILVMTYRPAHWPAHAHVRFLQPLLAAELAPLRDPVLITQTVIHSIQVQLAQEKSLLE